MALTKQLIYLGDFLEDAKQLKKQWGKTDLFSTGQTALDDYLCGGFGRCNGYEIVLLYGPTGVGKSTVALNMMAPAIIDGVKVGLLVLEDDMADVSLRLSEILTPDQYAEANRTNTVRCLPAEALTKSWNLNDLLEYIEAWFVDEKIELILLDHLQFAFESAESIRGENEYIAQRIFMQKLNQLMKRTKKTIILVSHINKANGVKGMDKVVGSGAITQAATKVISIKEDRVPDTIQINMLKSRFTKKPGFHWCMTLIDSKLGTAK